MFQVRSTGDVFEFVSTSSVPKTGGWLLKRKPRMEFSGVPIRRHNANRFDSDSAFLVLMGISEADVFEDCCDLAQSAVDGQNVPRRP